MTGLMSSIAAGGIGTLNAPIVLSNFNLRGARYPLLLGASTLSNDGTTQPPLAILDVGLSFTQPNWWYNIAVRNQSGTTAYDVLADVRYKLTSYSSPGFYGGSYDDATTLTYTWTQQTGAPAQQLFRLNVDDTGLTAVGITATSVYVTTDGGATWAIRTSGLNTPTAISQACLARSAPLILYCAVITNAGGSTLRLYKSINGGVSWATVSGSFISSWRYIKCNHTGVLVLASQATGSLYLSRDSGASFTQYVVGGVSRTWNGVYLSDDGQILVGVENNGTLWVSTNSGTSWTSRATTRNWGQIAGSSDGSTLLAGTGAGIGLPCLYLSTDFGTTWTATSTLTNAIVNQVTTSINGNKLAAIASVSGVTGLYVSQDGGATWSTPSGAPTGTRFSVGMSPDGTRLIVGGNTAGTLYPYTAVGV